MPEFKRQHYVSQLHLKYFSDDSNRKLITVFNPDSGFYRRNCPIKDQAKESYFYGADGKLERMLAETEDRVAPIIRNLCETRRLPKPTEDDYLQLLTFTMLMSARTKKQVEGLNETVNGLFQTTARLDGMDVVEKRGIKARFKNPPLASISTVVNALPGVLDLKVKLLINQSNVPFVTSDNPAVVYNQFLESRNHPGGHTGTLSKGLQIFFPMSPKLMLIYYDDWAYKVGDKKPSVVSFTNAADSWQLNRLQMVNCQDSVYLNGSLSEDELKKQSKYLIAVRQQSSVELVERRSTTAHGQEKVILATHKIDRKINLSVSFIKIRKNAKEHTLSGSVIQLRKESYRYNRPRLE